MGRSKRHFDITLVFSFIFILVCLFAVWSLKEVGREKTPSQPQIMPTETKPTPIYEPLKPLPREEDSIKEKPVEGEPVEEEPYKDEAIIQEPKRELDVIEDKIEVYKKVDPKLEEYIRSFFTELGCKVQDNWVIDVPTVYSIEWLKRRLDLKLLELGYKLNGNIVFKDNEELLRLGFEKSQPKGRIAIIIDDIGRSTRLNRVLEEIDLPLNISILPKQSKSKDMSLVGMKKGWDVLLHLPMEPKEKSWIDSTFIKVGMDKKEIEGRIDSYIKELPYVNGINNHMGSLATADKRVMEIILDIVKDRGLYYIDSLTTSDSVGEKVSREVGLERFAKRDIFLDNIDDRSYVESQMEKLIEVSIRKGVAIGIGHLRENTISTIKDYNWEDKEIELVLLSEILK